MGWKSCSQAGFPFHWLDRLLYRSLGSVVPSDMLNQSQGEMRRWWGSYDGAGAFSKYGPQGFTGATQLMIIAT